MKIIINDTNEYDISYLNLVNSSDTNYLEIRMDKADFTIWKKGDSYKILDDEGNVLFVGTLMDFTKTVNVDSMGNIFT